MAIISGDKFFGGKEGTVVQSTSSPLFAKPAPTAPQSTPLSVAGDTLKETGKQVVEGVKKAFTAPQGALQRAGEAGAKGDLLGIAQAAIEAPLGMAAGAVQAIFAPLTGAILTSARELDKATGGAISDKIEAVGKEHPEVLRKVSEIIAKHPQVAQDIGDVVSLIGVKLAPTVGKTLKESASALAQEAEMTTRMVGAKVADVVKPVTKKVGTLFKRKASSIDDIAAQIDEGKTPMNRDAVNAQIDNLVNEGKTAEARALAEANAPQMTFTEKLGGLRPDIKQRIQGKPELMQEYLDVVNTRNVNDTAKSVIEHGGDYVRKAADTMEQKLGEVGGDIGAFRQKVGTYKAPVTEVARIEKTFSSELSKLNLELKGGVIKQKAGTISKVNSESEIKVLNDLFAELQVIKQSPDLQRLIDFRNLFDSKINFAKSTRDVSSSLDPFSRVMRKDIADIAAKIVGKSEAKNLTKYSEFMDALNQLKSFTDRKAGGEYLLRVVLSGRGGEARNVVKTIKEYTGIDLMDHATMMQVTNEMLGNAAQKTLFRQEMTNAGLDVASLLAGDPRGAAMTLFNKATDRFINPEKLLMEAAKSKP